MDILTKIKELQRRLESITSLPIHSHTRTSSIDKSSFQTVLFERHSSNHRKLSNFNNTHDLFATNYEQNEKISFENRIESIEIKLDHLISLFSNKNNPKSLYDNRKNSVM